MSTVNTSTVAINNTGSVNFLDGSSNPISKISADTNRVRSSVGSSTFYGSSGPFWLQQMPFATQTYTTMTANTLYNLPTSAGRGFTPPLSGGKYYAELEVIGIMGTTTTAPNISFAWTSATFADAMWRIEIMNAAPNASGSGAWFQIGYSSPTSTAGAGGYLSSSLAAGTAQLMATTTLIASSNLRGFRYILSGVLTASGTSVIYPQIALSAAQTGITQIMYRWKMMPYVPDANGWWA